MIKINCHSGVGQNLFSLTRKIPAFAGMTLFLLIASPSFAEDKKEEPKQEEITEEKENPEEEKPAEKPEGYYSPDFCDFEITFPEKPSESRRCPPASNECYRMMSYVMVYDLATTVEVSANCAPSTAASYDRYDEPVIKAALSGMANRTEIKNVEINAQEIDGTRQGSLLGTGTYGKQSKIYNAQLLVGKNSIMTIEAELIGAEHPEADETFSDILKSIQIKEKSSSD